MDMEVSAQARREREWEIPSEIGIRRGVESAPPTCVATNFSMHAIARVWYVTLNFVERYLYTYS